MNPYKVGDKVIILSTIKDSYGEVWYHIGDSDRVAYISMDRLGVFFSCGLGTHYKNVKMDIESIRDDKITSILV